MSTSSDQSSTPQSIEMDNSGNGPLQVPGFGDVPFDYAIATEDCFVSCGFDQRPGVTIREFAMVAAMNAITDEPDWHIGIFDDDQAQNWRAKAEAAYPVPSGGHWPKGMSSMRLLSDKAWDWCLRELRDKAKDFANKRFVRVLDTGSCICKSDTLMTSAVAQKLRAELAAYCESPSFEQARSRRDRLVDVVDPGLFPLIYGRTPVLQDGSSVDPNDLFKAYSDAKRAPPYNHHGDEDDASQPSQWLPFEVSFTEAKGPAVRISSYITSVHPGHHGIYGSIEEILSHSIPMWDECLVKGLKDLKIDVDIRQEELDPLMSETTYSHYLYNNDQRQRGRVPLRIVSYGIPTGPRMPDWAKYFDGSPYKNEVRAYRKAIAVAKTSADWSDRARRSVKHHAKNDWWQKTNFQPLPKHKLPPPSPEQWKMAAEFLTSPELGGLSLPTDWMSNTFALMETRVRDIQEKWDYPEPGDAVSYDDWRDGKDVHRPVVPRYEVAYRINGEIDERYAPTNASHQTYTINLRERFKKQGLQVFARVSGIELAPTASEQQEDRAYESWQDSGQRSEHIVATAIYVYDTVNIDDCRLKLRQSTSASDSCYRYRPNGRAYGWKHNLGRWQDAVAEEEERVQSLRAIQHSDYCSDCVGNSNPDTACCDVGQVRMPEGRLITYPRLMEHQFVLPKLLDQTKPGHCRFVTLYLVDPHYRICSTRNVPPQQHEWWEEEVSALLSKVLPQEIVDQICQITREIESGFMSRDEAQSMRDYGGKGGPLKARLHASWK